MLHLFYFNMLLRDICCEMFYSGRWKDKFRSLADDLVSNSLLTLSCLRGFSVDKHAFNFF